MPGTTPADGDILQVRAVCFTLSQVSLNITHYRVVSGAGIRQTLTQVAAQIDSILSNRYKAWMPPAASWRGIGVTNLTGDRTVEEVSVGNAGIGTVAGTNLVPPQVSGLISRRTASAGKHFRGRIYPGFVSQGFMATDGTLTGAGRTALDDIRVGYNLTQLIATGADQLTLQMVILHRPTPARPIPPSTLTTDVTSQARSELLASQRRRGGYGAQNQPPF